MFSLLPPVRSCIHTAPSPRLGCDRGGRLDDPGIHAQEAGVGEGHVGLLRPRLVGVDLWALHPVASSPWEVKSPDGCAARVVLPQRECHRCERDAAQTHSHFFEARRHSAVGSREERWYLRLGHRGLPEAGQRVLRLPANFGPVFVRSRASRHCRYD